MPERVPSLYAIHGDIQVAGSRVWSTTGSKHVGRRRIAACTDGFRPGEQSSPKLKPRVQAMKNALVWIAASTVALLGVQPTPAPA